MTPTATKTSSDVIALGKGQNAGGELSERLRASSTLRPALRPSTSVAGEVFSSFERSRIGREIASSDELAQRGRTLAGQR